MSGHGGCVSNPSRLGRLVCRLGGRGEFGAGDSQLPGHGPSPGRSLRSHPGRILVAVANEHDVPGPAVVVRSFRFKLDPTVGQARVLDRLVGVQRELYNAALEERREAWRRARVRRTRIDQFKELTGAMAALSELAEFGLQAARGTLWRLDRAFAGFFRRVAAGRSPATPG